MNASARDTTTGRRRHEAAIETPYVPPYTDTECALAKIWTEVLGLDRVGIDDDLFELSRGSVQPEYVLGRISQRRGTAWPVEMFLRCPTIRRVAAAIDRFNVPRASKVDVDSLLSV